MYEEFKWGKSSDLSADGLVASMEEIKKLIAKSGGSMVNMGSPVRFQAIEPELQEAHDQFQATCDRYADWNTNGFHE